VYSFDQEAAAAVGQSPFTLNLRRMAFVPVAPAWFPELNTPDHGIVGRAPERLRVTLEAAIKDLFTRRTESVERLGPLWRR
jgi:hypothetical protein